MIPLRLSRGVLKKRFKVLKQDSQKRRPGEKPGAFFNASENKNEKLVVNVIRSDEKYS